MNQLNIVGCNSAHLFVESWSCIELTATLTGLAVLSSFYLPCNLPYTTSRATNADIENTRQKHKIALLINLRYNISWRTNFKANQFLKMTSGHYIRNLRGSPLVPPPILTLLREPSKIESVDEEALTLAFTDTACGSGRLVGGKGCQLGLLTRLAPKVLIKCFRRRSILSVW